AYPQFDWSAHIGAPHGTEYCHPCHSRLVSCAHSRTCANSSPINSSFLPGCANMYPYSRRRLANFCHSSPGILQINDPLPCTTSSCERGKTKFSVKPYNMRNVSRL